MATAGPAAGRRERQQRCNKSYLINLADIEKNIQFVKCVEKFPSLYNYNDPDYLKKDICDNAWQEVANESQLPVLECKEKWKNLRYGLLRSLRLNPDGRAKKKYYLHDAMAFLLPYMSSKQYEIFTRSIDGETADEDLKIDQDNDQSSIYQPQYQEVEFFEPVRKKSKIIEPVNIRLDKSDSEQLNDESRKMFVLGLMPEINALTNYQMRVFRRKILALLDEVADGPSECDTWSGDSFDQEPQERLQNYSIKQEPS